MVGTAHKRLCPPYGRARPSYFTAEKRLSNELAGTIGCAPATSASFAGGAAAGSEIVGLNGGRVAAATLVSTGFGAAAGFGTAAAGRVSLVSMTFGLAATAVEVVSAPDSPTLRARLEKKPSDFASGAAEATRVAGAAAGVTATTGSS